MPKFKDTKIKYTINIVKLSDDKFNGNHPCGVHEGHTKKGTSFYLPTVGERFYVDLFNTSPVTKIIDDKTFKTLNSTYRYEILEKHYYTKKN